MEHVGPRPARFAQGTQDLDRTGNGGRDDLNYARRPTGTTGLPALGDEAVGVEHSEPLLLHRRTYCAAPDSADRSTAILHNAVHSAPAEGGRRHAIVRLER